MKKKLNAIKQHIGYIILRIQRRGYDIKNVHNGVDVLLPPLLSIKNHT